MKLSQLYNRALAVGVDYDVRGKSYLLKKSRYLNPYPDSQILYGDGDRDVKNILVGIDIEAAELLLADRIRQKESLDLVISHHPEGKGLYWLYDVMRLQIQMLKKMGISKEAATALVEERMQEVERKFMAYNHMRSVDVARILNIPFLCLHTPADNMASYFIQKLMQDKKPRVVRDVLDILYDIPEYKIAKNETAGPRVLLGNPQRAVGEIFVEMTGGTEGPKEVFGRLYDKGIRTLICMHLSEEHFKKVKDIGLNVIIAGHISSDNLGLNLLLDKIGKKEKFHIVECSGFRRIPR
jgi:putative NIF3 family GTP cyclohydrolase 1 type 2